MIRVIIALLITISTYTQASTDYHKVLNQFKTVCLEKVHLTCTSLLKGAAETKLLLADTLKLMALNNEFSTLYTSTYGEEAFLEFNDAFKFSTSPIDLSDYTLKSKSNEQFTLKDAEGNTLTFDNTNNGWRLNVDKSLSGVLVKEAKQLVAYSIGAYLSLITKIETSIPVEDAFKLGGRYFIVASYDYFDAEAQIKLDEIFKEKSIDAAKLRQDMLSFYKQQD
ncbi:MULTISPECIES: hypothetical protein [unclassified Colwellia]|uniref:hypothetical protein n=1 Tax=unclassified Colwellia TaxID=196834 RepID=UPI0015F6154D|nr:MULTISPECIES: hypothetical protein [unclassified Colwellia]MBA6357889.1 hypothetical protein [Colwellia sp. BRX8-3]MBA6360454.1 hypothetical protein [Colwellia sp. BRX8-6]MBA6368755.1 hypothetical protein [Colwellia sp. BRX8-5]MBA6376505.1 hypothetical protein [Colwellia sp. BRX8-2]